MKRFILGILLGVFLFSVPCLAWDDGKLPYTLRETAPAVTDADYYVPYMWVDTVNDKFYLLIDHSK